MSLHTHISFHIPCLLIYLLCSPIPSDISLIIFLLNLCHFVCLYPLYNPFPSYIPFVYQSTLHVPAGTSMTPMFPMSHPHFFPTSPNIPPKSMHISLCSLNVFRCPYLHPIYPNVTQHPQIPHEPTCTIISPMSPIFSLYPMYTCPSFSPCISSQCPHVSCICPYSHTIYPVTPSVSYHHTLSLCYYMYPLCPLYVPHIPTSTPYIPSHIFPYHPPIYQEFITSYSSLYVPLVLPVSNVSPCPMYHSRPLHVPHKHVHTC